VKTALHWALVVAALAYTAYKAPPLFSAAGQELRNLGQVRWGWAVAALVLGLAAVALYGEIQRELLVVGGAPLPATTVQGITFAENAVAVTVPVVGGAVAIGYAISRFHRRGADTPVVSWAVLLAGAVTTLCLAGMTAIALAAVGRLSVPVAGVLLVAIVSVAVGGWQLVTHPTGLRSLVRPVLHLAQHVPGRCPSCRASRLAQLDSRVDGVATRLGLLRPSPARWLVVVVLGCLSYGLDFAGLSAASAAVLPGVPWAALVWGYLLVQGSIALQILPGGAGLAEVGLLGALMGAGVDAAPAAGVVLLYRISSWLMPAAIGWVAYAVQIHGIRPLPHRHVLPAAA
jgi:putative heme transporter